MLDRAMRVAFVQPPLRVPVDYVDLPYLVDVGLLQCAAVAERCGYDVTVVDAFAMASSRAMACERWIDLGAPADEVVAVVRQADPHVVVLAHTPYAIALEGRRALTLLVTRLRAACPAATLVAADCYVGGMHYRAYDGETTRRVLGVDHVIRYESERAIVRLLEALAAGERATEVIDGTEELDPSTLPLPAWRSIDLDAHDAFLGSVAASGRRLVTALDGRTLPVLFSRGCPFHCCFCTSNPGRPPGTPKRQRRMSRAAIERAVTELGELGASRLVVLDELPNLDPAEFAELVGLLEARELAFELPNGLRADRLAPGMVARLARTVGQLAVSAESGSQRVVDEVVGKRQSLAAVRRVAEEASAVGLPLRVHWILGIPGETRAELGETLTLAAELAALGAEPALQFAVPFEGSALERAAPAGALELPADHDRASLLTRRPLLATAAATPDELVAARALLERGAAARRTRRLIANVSYRCNNHCAFCAVGDRARLDAPLDDLVAALERYAADGVVALDLDGGEPTLYPRLLPLLEAARRLGYRPITIATNGRRLGYPHFAAALLDGGFVDVVRLSLHGPRAEIHEALTAVPGSFEQSLAGLRAALARPALETAVSTTFVRQNLDHLEELAHALHELGARRWTLQALTPFGRAHAGLLPDDEAVARVLGPLIERWGDALGIDVVNLPFCRLPGHELRLGPDLDKCERDMLFVGGVGTNLADFLGGARVRTEACERCLHRAVCRGFYRFPDRGGVADARSNERDELPLVGNGTDSQPERARATRSAVQVAKEPGSTPAVAPAPGALLDLVLAYRCNSGCRFCAIDDDARGAALAPEAARAELELGRAFADRVRFGGGEPTLRRDLPALVAHAYRLGYRDIALQTNGYLLAYPTHVERLARAGLRSCHVSVRGADAATHEGLTRVPGSFALVERGITNLLGAGIAVTADVIVVRQNLAELGRVVSHYHAMGIRAFHFWYVAPEGRAAHDDTLVPTMSEAAPAVALAISQALSLGVSSALAYYLPRCLLPGLEPHVWDPAAERALVVTPRDRFNLERGAIDLGVKVEACRDCPEASRCIGIRPAYFARHGAHEIVGMHRPR